jgi:HK97 family phage major capsid protein
MSTAEDVFRQVQQKRAELKAMWDKHNTGQTHLVNGVETPIFDFPPTIAEELERREKELNDLQDSYVKLDQHERYQKNAAELQEYGNIKRRLVGPGTVTLQGYDERVNRKSLGERFVDSPAFKLRRDAEGKASATFDDMSFTDIIAFKTLLTTGGAPGFAPDSPRTGRVVGYAERVPTVADLIPKSDTDVAVHKWMEEQAPTNNASQIGEGVSKPESTLDWNEVTQSLTKIAHWVQATEEQVDDVPGLVSLINNRLVRLLELQEENQILYGNGSGNNMQGFLTKSGLQTQAFDTNNMDTVFKAIIKVNWTGFARASGVVMNPANWQTARLVKGATNLDYIMGSPMGTASHSDAGYRIGYGAGWRLR